MKLLIVYFFFTLLILLTSSSVAYSQKFTGGIAAGLAASQVDGDSYSGYNKAGISAGGWVNLSFSERSAFQVGLNFIQKGSRHNPDTEKEDYNSLLIRVNYAEMPILYQYKMKNRFYLEAGTSLGVMISHKEEINLLTTNYPFRILDISFQTGVGYQVNEKIKFGLRSGNSMLSIRKDKRDGYRRRFFDYGQYNNVLALELSYIL
jgi:hypothetical protein